MPDVFAPLKSILDGFLGIIFTLKVVTAWIFDLENIIPVLWALAWTMALAVGIWQLCVVRGDRQAVIRRRIQNGRRIIANGNFRTMWLLVLISILNLIPGIVVLLLLPNHWIGFEVARITNLLCLLVAAFLTTALIFGKRRDRALWEREYRRE